MADSKSGSGSDDGPKDAGDPLLALAIALLEMWSLGSAAVENILVQGGGSAGPFAPYLDSLLRAASAFGDAALGDDAAQPDTAGKGAGIAALVVQAYLVAMVSGLRYWRRIAHTYGAHQSGILRSLVAKATGPSMSDEERRTLIDEIRAYLRQVADVSLQEARIFQSELEKVAAQITAAGGAGDDPSGPRRRWKAKP